MKHTKFVILFLLSLISLPAIAQFTIKDTRERQLIPPAIPQEKVTILPPYKWEYVNEAMLQNMKRIRRKERNTLEFTARMSFSQNTFENWSGGGENSMSTLGEFDFKHLFKATKFSFETTAAGKYGLNYVDKEKFKNQDEFWVNLKSNWAIHKRWSYSANANFRSQFAPGYKNRDAVDKNSDFMSPGYLKLSAGLSYTQGALVILFSPVSGDARFVIDDKLSDAGAYGVEKGKTSKWQIGPSLKINYDKWVVKDAIRIKSEMYSFTNLQSSPNFRWNATVILKTMKIFETTLNGEMRFDELSKAEKPSSMQYKTLITVGLGYTIKNK